MGVLDDGYQFACVAGASLLLCLATMIRPLVGTSRCARSDPAVSDGDGSAVADGRATRSWPNRLELIGPAPDADKGVVDDGTA